MYVDKDCFFCKKLYVFGRVCLSVCWTCLFCRCLWELPKVMDGSFDWSLIRGQDLAKGEKRLHFWGIDPKLYSGYTKKNIPDFQMVPFFKDEKKSKMFSMFFQQLWFLGLTFLKKIIRRWNVFSNMWERGLVTAGSGHNFWNTKNKQKIPYFFWLEALAGGGLRSTRANFRFIYLKKNTNLTHKMLNGHQFLECNVTIAEIYLNWRVLDSVTCGLLSKLID